jgi:hypothetical protein
VTDSYAHTTSSQLPKWLQLNVGTGAREWLTAPEITSLIGRHSRCAARKKKKKCSIESVDQTTSAAANAFVVLQPRVVCVHVNQSVLHGALATPLAMTACCSTPYRQVTNERPRAAPCTQFQLTRHAALKCPLRSQSDKVLRYEKATAQRLRLRTAVAVVRSHSSPRACSITLLNILQPVTVWLLHAARGLPRVLTLAGTHTAASKQRFFHPGVRFATPYLNQVDHAFTQHGDNC